MKRRVKYSGWVFFVTCMVFVEFGLVVSFGVNNGMPRWFVGIIGSLLLALIVLSLFYMPVSVSVENGLLTVHRPLASKKILHEEILSVELCQPTLAERAILGSGRFCGYWGWFKESYIGKYFAYYGKASDCFLVTLRSGKKYLLGCENPQAVIACLNK